MWICPVCGRENATPFCPMCGFDRSADVESAPTFSGLNQPRKSNEQLRRERDDLLICPGCGGTAFEISGSGLRCRVCGQTTQRTHSAATPGKKTIIAIAAGDAHTAVLYSDGTVRAVGKNNWGQCNTGSWRDITAICAGYAITLGLRRDGTVVSTCNNFAGKAMVHTLRDVKAISASYGGHTLFLKTNGTAESLGDNSNNERSIIHWSNLVAVAAGGGFSLGLRADGTVYSAGINDNNRCNAQYWRDIAAISVGSWHSLGLTRSGTAIAIGRNDEHQCNVSEWRNLVQVVGGAYFSAGLRADGTVCVATSQGNYTPAEGWSQIIALSAGHEHLVGLRSDGALLTVGVNTSGQCDVDPLFL